MGKLTPVVSKNKQKNNQTWADVKRIVKLTAEEVEMAKQCGMSPRDVRANYSSTFQEKWKGSTGEWIRDCYEKKFGAEKAAVTEPSSTLEWASPPEVGESVIVN